MIGAAASVSMSDMSYEQRRTAMAALGAGATYGVILPFSRDHETEADKMGLLYMARAGYDPNEAINFWRRMAQEGGPKAPEFASTHPSNETRIRDLQQFLPKALEEFEKSRRPAGR
jgi:predicted Zn-dependent protease